MRTLLVLLALAIATPWYVFRVLVAATLGKRGRDYPIYHNGPKRWGMWMCRAAGVRVHTHGMEHLADGPHIIIANHVSWFDVFALASVLPRFAFIAKAELERIPLFGRAMRASGQLFVNRQNRKAAFAQYDDAAQRIRKGATVVIFPEGTRGHDYPLRPFKKGPFVLAIAAGVPITPVLIHGSMEVLRKGQFRVRRNDIHIHVLTDIAAAGLTYEDRGRLAWATWSALADAQYALYGITSTPPFADPAAVSSANGGEGPDTAASAPSDAVQTNTAVKQ
jgi:1-acyl-sn-glycerol-3-phosphate acyltransferase